MSKSVFNKIPDLLDPVWSDRTHFYLLNLQEDKGIVFPSLPPFLPSYLLIQNCQIQSHRWSLY